MIPQLFALFGPRRRPARLPFVRGELARDDIKPVVVSLTEKEAKRCIEAIEFYIETFAPELERRGLDEEIARYEHLMYRFMSVPPESMGFHEDGRRRDARE